MEKKTGPSPVDAFIGQELGTLVKVKQEQGDNEWASSLGGKFLTTVLYLENKSVGPVMEIMLERLFPMIEEIRKNPELCQQLVAGIISEMSARRMGVKRE